MKVCCSCKESKPLSEFAKNRSKPSGVNNECKICYKLLKKKTTDHRVKLIRRYKRIKGCACCGYNTFGSALTFDHIDPDSKCNHIKGRGAINYTWSMKRIKAEIAKCRVICSNCHNAHSQGELKI